MIVRRLLGTRHACNSPLVMPLIMQLVAHCIAIHVNILQSAVQCAELSVCPMNAPCWKYTALPNQLHSTIKMRVTPAFPDQLHKTIKMRVTPA